MFSELTLLISILALTARVNSIPAPLPTNNTVHLEPAAIAAARLTALVPASAAANPTLLTCSSPGCTGGCSQLSLLNAVGKCFSTVPFTSMFLSDPSFVLPLGVVEVAPGNYANWVALPHQGVCYNLIGGQFRQYGVRNI
ncbi:hypothetical protein C8Q76DRAFT_429772 [Earliella scabrosa]|nr:hypothetical protein C8Q76DRAFT_429772 [Earliella scabrosa]